MDKFIEINCDGLAGPNYNYGGLTMDNISSKSHRYELSYPKATAIQGLNKMKAIMDFGLIQVIIPPILRPDWTALYNMGLKGSHNDIIRSASLDQLISVYSSSNMWTANSATISPSPDTKDNKLHITIANLVNNFHRSLEPKFSYSLFTKLFHSDSIIIHKPLMSFADEGSANHLRLCNDHGQKAIEVFVYGYSSDNDKPVGRQSKEASEEVIHNHNVKDSLLVRQNPDVIDKGVFHNDVIALSHLNILIIHEMAFANQAKVLADLKDNSTVNLNIIEISNTDLPIDMAVKTYFFNGQLFHNANSELCLILPNECKDNKYIDKLLNRLRNSIDLKRIVYVDLKGSMLNGGGPGCLRLRIVISEDQLDNIHKGVVLTHNLYNELLSWIDFYYRDELRIEDLKNPILAKESKLALRDLAYLLKLEDLYSR